MSKNYDTIVRECKRVGTLFEDPDFPPTDENIFFSRAPPRPFVWKRPKEIVDDPQWIVGGGSRFDIQQGMLGDCWLLSAISSLTVHAGLFKRVVDDNQNFGENYCGVFRFRLWREGKWQEVVVDDRLPTYNNRLVFMHSAEKNEFWSALLEKAFAKLSGSYEACKGGQTSEAMCDLTGGVTETFELGEKAPSNLMKIMLKAHGCNSLMACSIEASSNEIEAKLSNGLVKGHSYSITGVTIVTARSRQGEKKCDLVRVRNPWGNEREWKGAWSDASHEWQMLSDEEKSKMNLTYDDDGEFWMSYSDWCNNFTKLEICNLGPDSITDNERKHWESFQMDGEWVRGISAGGCRNFINSFASNPQFRVTLTDPDDDDEEDNCSVVVAILQKGRRKLKEKGGQFLTIGFAIYEVDDVTNSEPLSKEFFMYNSSKARSSNYVNSREICGRFQLKPGTYAVIPSTFDPGENGKFLIRIFSEKANPTQQLDTTTRFDKIEERRPPTEMEKKFNEKFYKLFEKLAGTDNVLDAFELEALLSSSFKAELDGAEFGTASSRTLLALFDKSGSGKLDFQNFKELWAELANWRRQFLNYDTDKSGDLSTYELRGFLSKVGIRLSNVCLTAMGVRYGNAKGKINFREAILCIARLRFMLDAFDVPNRGYAEFSADTFVKRFMSA